MRVLKTGIKGTDVKEWQWFLIGQGFQPGVADGIFGAGTKAATMAFQRRHLLDSDGAVGNRTLAAAMKLGFEEPRPQFPPLITNAERQRVFGRFAYEHKPLANNPENILIAGGWREENIVMVTIPELVGVPGAPRDGRIQFHRLVSRQLIALWAAWRSAKLSDRVLTWGGSFVPRFVRGSRTVLSNHAFGTAFDINAAWNPLKIEPARVGQPGCVRELVAIANEHGFYWGGHFTRRDGMHFEAAKIF